MAHAFWFHVIHFADGAPFPWTVYELLLKVAGCYVNSCNCIIIAFVPFGYK
jgi:hypothetical protein